MLATFLVSLAGVGMAWEHIPDPFPSHWNASGEADAFMDKTWPNLIFMFGLVSLILALVVAGTFAFMHQHAKHQRGEDWKIARTRAMTNTMLNPLGMWMFILNAIIVVSIFMSVTTDYSGLGLDMVAILVVVVMLIFTMAKNQQWVDKHYPDPEISQYMKWGIFYYNPDNPNMMVHTDFNSTFNMAHKGGQIAMIGLLGFPIVLIIGLIIIGL